MKKKVNWLQLVESNEDKILEALIDVYREAAMTASPGMFYPFLSLILSDDGKIRKVIEPTDNSIDGDVWVGNAIYLTRIQCFDVLDGEYEEDLIQQYADSFDITAYETFLSSKGDDISMSSLREFDEKIYSKIVEDVKYFHDHETAQNWAEQTFDGITHQLKAEADWD